VLLGRDAHDIAGLFGGLFTRLRSEGGRVERHWECGMECEKIHLDSLIECAIVVLPRRFAVEQAQLSIVVAPASSPQRVEVASEVTSPKKEWLASTYSSGVPPHRYS
jgi:hypothetical protein